MATIKWPRIHVRATTHAKVKKAAKKAGVPMTRFADNALLSYLKSPTREAL